jgi:hypothetical protein
MLDEGVMTLAEIQNEIDLGYFRPSLIEELRDPAALEGFDPKRAKAAGGERQGRQLRQAQGGVRGGAAAEAGDPRVRGGGGERGSARDQSQEAESVLGKILTALRPVRANVFAKSKRTA